jgi:protein-tyrosine phosphatase
MFDTFRGTNVVGTSRVTDAGRHVIATHRVTAGRGMRCRIPSYHTFSYKSKILKRTARPRVGVSSDASGESASTHAATKDGRTPNAFVSADSRMEEYNKKMAERMGWIDNPYEYKPERGLYYHYIAPNLLVGSQPLSSSDVDHLRDEEHVNVVMSLQQMKDLEYWGVNYSELEEAASDSDMEYVRIEAVDFDPNSLRATLPRAVSALEKAQRRAGKVYVHCTAGLGRSPAVAIASLFWLHDFDLDEAYEYVTSIRPCGPNKDAIRGATFDMLDNRDWHEFQWLPEDAYKYLSTSDRDRIRQILGIA